MMLFFTSVIPGALAAASLAVELTHNSVPDSQIEIGHCSSARLTLLLVTASSASVASMSAGGAFHADAL